jgi:hypothetical protein
MKNRIESGKDTKLPTATIKNEFLVQKKYPNNRQDSKKSGANLGVYTSKQGGAKRIIGNEDEENNYYNL